MLDAYIAAQQELEPGGRLTHVTAVLRYPPPPPGRHRPDGRVRVPARLPADTMEKVTELTLRLPGQPRRRGLKDYVRSPLAEALTTAIACDKPFDVPGLEDIPPIWTQRAAVSLWHLTVAATLTVPEQLAVLGNLEALDADAENPTELTQILRDGHFAWHHPWRFEVALHLARNLLTGPKRVQNWRSLKNRDDEFEVLRFDFERTDDLDHTLLRGAPKHAISNVTGRGGALVWRARRSLALQAIRNWIVSKPTTPLTVSPPYVKIVHPKAWTSVRVPADDHLPAQVIADAEAGKVLLLSTDESISAWPYLRETGEPVPRFDIVIEELARRRPEEVVELVLLDDPRLADVYLDPALAYDLGFITADERDALIEDAAKRTAGRIETTLKRAENWTPDEHAELDALRDDPERFFELAAEHHISEGVVRPWWVWEAGPTVTELDNLAGAPDRLRQLVRSRGRNWKRQLEATMEAAGRAAIAHGYADPEHLAYYDAECGESDEDETEFNLGGLVD
ncbi:hypothetical protein [Ornithinimicrobium murale]|uniref:hypothetical protein n=1 Tax=Ornithinimicrobium murale TaxID=1050153 RepID=UPI0013B3D8CC|nr:hypothetical protein [Ornithinimicrobium murale]